MTLADHRKLEQQARELRAREMERMLAAAWDFLAVRLARVRSAKLVRPERAREVRA